MKRIGWSLLLVMLFGCGTEEGDAIVDVRWAIGGTNCTRVGVERVTVSLVKGGLAVAGAEAQCEEGAVEIHHITMGTYTVQVFGYRLGEENPSFVGQEAGIEVPKGGRVTTAVIYLQEAPGAVDLTWRFESGKLCRFEGADWVQISVFDERNRLVSDMELPCDPDLSVGSGQGGAGSEYLEDARGVVIEYLFSGTHEVIVLAYRNATDTEAQWGGSGTAEVASFELSPVDVVLTPCTDEPDSLCW